MRNVVPNSPSRAGPRGGGGGVRASPDLTRWTLQPPCTGRICVRSLSGMEFPSCSRCWRSVDPLASTAFSLYPPALFDTPHPRPSLARSSAPRFDFARPPPPASSSSHPSPNSRITSAWADSHLFGSWVPPSLA
jgi:hypothetical protein